MVKRLLELALLIGVGISLYYAREAWLPKAKVATAAAPVAPMHATANPPVEAAPSPPAALKEAASAGLTDAESANMAQIRARFATGDFVGALHLADDAMVKPGISNAYHSWLIDQLPVLLTSAGWARLKVGECEEATAFLRRSEAMKRTPETTKGLAVCYYKLKNLAAAREQFASYLEKQPNDFQMQLLYTDVLESDGRFDEAVHILEQLVATPPSTDPNEPARPDPETLKQRLATMRVRAKESGLQQTDTSHNFRLAYRAGDHEDLVAFVLQTLEDALDEYVDRYGIRPPAEPIEVVLYPAAEFRSVAGGPEWAEGLFDGRLRIPVRPEVLQSHQYAGLVVVLRHELVHALLSLMTDSRPLPPWFDEGLAQRLSCTGQPCAAFRFEPQPGAFLPAQAFTTSYIALSTVSAGRSYKQSLYLVLTLEQRFGADILRQLISHITVSSDLSSDGILAPVGPGLGGLNGLVAIASEAWGRQVIPAR